MPPHLFCCTTVDERGLYRAEARVGTLEGKLLFTGIGATEEEAREARAIAYDHNWRVYDLTTNKEIL